MCSREAEYSLDRIRGTGVKQATKHAFAEDAISRALKKFKGSFGLDTIQNRHRKSGFKSGNPYNDDVWNALLHCKIIEEHRIANVSEGGLNVVEDKDVRREIMAFFDNGVFGRRLRSVFDELSK